MANDSEAELISEWPVHNDETNNGRTRNLPQKRRHDFQCQHFIPGKSKTTRREDREQLANVTLAKWWRRCGTHIVDRKPATSNPNTLLRFISR